MIHVHQLHNVIQKWQEYKIVSLQLLVEKIMRTLKNLGAFVGKSLNSSSQTFAAIPLWMQILVCFCFIEVTLT